MTNNNNKLIMSAWAEQSVELFELIQPRAHSRSAKKNAVLLRQGEQVKNVWFILRGRATAFTYSHSGQKVWISDLVPGDLFGHAAILSERQPNLQIVAGSDLQYLTLTPAEFDQLMQGDPSISQQVSVDVSKRLYVSRSRYFELATLSASARVSAELLRMARTIGVDEDKLIIRPAPVHSNLALRVNSTRETVSRAVNKLQKNGILVKQPGALVVLRPDQLKESMIPV